MAVSALLTMGGAVGVLVGARGTQSPSDGSPEAKTQQVFTTVCGRCHPVERITAMRRTRSQWEETIDTMISARGAQVTDEEYDTVLTFLMKEYGRVDVNRATSDDIVEVLGIADDLAAAIVAHRKQHGLFEDFEALLKVPGLDREALEKKRDAISF